MTSKIEEIIFFYLDKMKQKRRKAPCVKKKWYTRKVEQIKEKRERRRSSTGRPGWVALNIVVFVYRAYNSHAKGTVLF